MFSHSKYMYLNANLVCCKYPCLAAKPWYNMVCVGQSGDSYGIMNLRDHTSDQAIWSFFAQATTEPYPITETTF